MFSGHDELPRNIYNASYMLPHYYLAFRKSNPTQLSWEALHNRKGRFQWQWSRKMTKLSQSLKSLTFQPGSVVSETGGGGKRLQGRGLLCVLPASVEEVRKDPRELQWQMAKLLWLPPCPAFVYKRTASANALDCTRWCCIWKVPSNIYWKINAYVYINIKKKWQVFPPEISILHSKV